MRMRPFTPRPAASVHIDTEPATNRVRVCDDKGDLQIRIANRSTSWVFINFGDDAVEATVGSGLAIGPGLVEVLTAPHQGSPLHVAAIAEDEDAEGAIYFTPGVGI